MIQGGFKGRIAVQQSYIEHFAPRDIWKKPTIHVRPVGARGAGGNAPPPPYFGRSFNPIRLDI